MSVSIVITAQPTSSSTLVLDKPLALQVSGAPAASITPAAGIISRNRHSGPSTAGVAGRSAVKRQAAQHICIKRQPGPVVTSTMRACLKLTSEARAVQTAKRLAGAPVATDSCGIDIRQNSDPLNLRSVCAEAGNRLEIRANIPIDIARGDRCLASGGNHRETSRGRRLQTQCRR